MAAPMARGDVVIQVEGPLVSEPYVEMTIGMMRQFGGSVEAVPHPQPLSPEGRGENSEPLAPLGRGAGVGGLYRFHIPGRQAYLARSYTIEPDASAASYFWAAAAIAGGTVTVLGLNRDSLQGDVRFVEVLERMGCQAMWSADSVTVCGRPLDHSQLTNHHSPLRGIEVDMNAISDTVMTLCAVACFADGPTTIRNVAHIRHKETDRLAALAAELRRVGAGVEELPDGLRIHPAPLHGAVVETYNDHRMAMSLALLGLRVSGIRIVNPECVAKTYPDFFADLEKLRREEE
jgi:3-phosphoshikimate 1-carboxyvinyltransferase